MYKNRSVQGNIITNHLSYDIIINHLSYPNPNISLGFYFRSNSITRPTQHISWPSAGMQLPLTEDSHVLVAFLLCYILLTLVMSWYRNIPLFWRHLLKKFPSFFDCVLVPLH